METEPDLNSYVDNSDDEAAPPLPPPPLPPLPPSPSSDLPVMSGVLADDGIAAAAAPAGRGRGRGRGGGGSAIAGLAELDQSMGFRPPAGRQLQLAPLNYVQHTACDNCAERIAASPTCITNSVTVLHKHRQQWRETDSRHRCSSPAWQLWKPRW
jgi:hypothetical protein